MTASRAASCRCRAVAAVAEVEPLGDGTLLYSIATYLRPPLFLAL